MKYTLDRRPHPLIAWQRVLSEEDQRNITLTRRSRRNGTQKILYQWVWWLNLVYLSLCNHLQPAPQTPPLIGMLCQSSGLLCYLLHLMAKLHWPLCSIWAQLRRHKSDLGGGDYIHMLHYLHHSRALVFRLYLLCHILFLFILFIYLFIFLIGHIIILGHAPETGNIQNTKRCRHTHTNTDTHTQTHRHTQTQSFFSAVT